MTRAAGKTKKRTLLVVEGEKREPALLNCAFQAFGLDGERCIVPVCINIHALLDILRVEYRDDYDNIDLISILREHFPNASENLSGRFTDILLVFDFDPQDNRMRRVDLERLQRTFCDSTDMGQLYINYPAVESYRDFDCIGDVGFLGRSVSIDLCDHYKNEVGHRQNGLDDIASIDSLSFARILGMHISKLQHILFGARVEDTVYWGRAGSIARIGLDVMEELSRLLSLEFEWLERNGEVPVCCTCLLFVCAWPDKVDAVWRKVA